MEAAGGGGVVQSSGAVAAGRGGVGDRGTRVGSAVGGAGGDGAVRRERIVTVVGVAEAEEEALHGGVRGAAPLGLHVVAPLAQADPHALLALVGVAGHPVLGVEPGVAEAGEALAADERQPRRAALKVRGVSKWFGAERVLADVSFSIGEGESLVILGHSGSGKTTTLRIIAGLEKPDAGEILLNGRHIEHLRARERNIGVIFQSYALFPRMTVTENICFGLRIRGVRRT